MSLFYKGFICGSVLTVYAMSLFIVLFARVGFESDEAAPVRPNPNPEETHDRYHGYDGE